MKIFFFLYLFRWYDVSGSKKFIVCYCVIVGFGVGVGVDIDVVRGVIGFKYIVSVNVIY